jgi:hypothetical protein
MKKILFAVAWLVIALVVACSGDTTGPTTAATAIPTPTADTPTPRPAQEWRLESVSADGSTVTVSLFYHSTASVSVTLGGASETRRDQKTPVLGFIFENVTPGDHLIVIKDVMGNVATAPITVESPPLVDALLPLWLDEWVVSLDAGEVEFPPQSITRYMHQGEEVYYVVMQCCDQFSDLLDAGGNLIGHPDGGITGRGDGVTKFSPMDQEGDLIWPWP